MALNREQILNANDLKTETVAVPEWGGDVIIRTMTGAERDRFEESIFKTKGKDTETNFRNLRAKLLVMCIIDDEGNKLFTEKDIETLSSKSAKPLDRLFAAAQKLNGIGADDVDEMVKN